MTEKASTCVEVLRRAAQVGVMECRYCPAYIACPTGTAGWDNTCMLETAAEQIEALVDELEQTRDKLSELLHYVTGGRFSNASYSTDDMRRFVDDYNQCVCDECDELKDAKREYAAAIADMKDIADNYAVCMHCKKCDDESGACDKWHDKDGCWEWRGVQKPKEKSPE